MSDADRDSAGNDRDATSNSNFSSTSEVPEFQIVIKSESVESSTSTSTTDTVAHPHQSSSSTIPEVQLNIISTEKEESRVSRLLNSIVYTGEFLVPKIEKQSHLKRLQNLRKELHYLKDTAWKYDPIE